MSTAQILDGFPRFGIPQVSFDAIGNCLWVLFEDEEWNSWCGVFGRGQLSSREKVELLSDSECLVLASGRLYFVDVNRRTLLLKTEHQDITDAWIDRKRQRVFCCDWTNLYCYDSQRLVWKSQRISWDGITFSRLDAEQDLLFGTVNDLSESGADFRLDLESLTVHPPLDFNYLNTMPEESLTKSPEETIRQNAWWRNATIAGILAATFFSDVSHEMCTSVLPMFLASIHLGPLALGVMEGLADFVVCAAKLGGGFAGRKIKHKRNWAAGGYLVTTVCTAGLSLAHGLIALATLRSLAWLGRGFRAPLRDDLLSNAVEKTHFGRVYGLERCCDMLGAVVGPLIGALLIWAGWEFRSIIVFTLVPGGLAAAAVFFLAKDPQPSPVENSSEISSTAGSSNRPVVESSDSETSSPRIPQQFWVFLIGVGLFGLGDFSRSFLVYLASQVLGGEHATVVGTLSLASLLYMGHNLVSAAAAYPAGFYGDRKSKPGLLISGYALGVLTNLLLVWGSASLIPLMLAIALSGMYIAIEETLEKAVAAEMLPRELRSVGFGLLAGVNAFGDMLSSLTVGFFLHQNRPEVAFGIAAGCGLLGVAWLSAFWPRIRGQNAPAV